MNCVRTIALASLVAFASLSHAQETPRFEVMSEYVRQLLTMHDVQEAAARELKDAKDQNSMMMTSIGGSTRIKLELIRNINALKAMKIAPPFDSLAPNVIDLYGKKRELHDNLIQIASEFTAGPKPGVDYGNLAAAMPQITATLEYLDKALYDATPMFCLLLVDQERETNGKLEHLVITSAQRKQLVSRLDRGFGAQFRAKNPNYNTGAALVIRDFLVGNRKSAGEP